MSPAPKASLPVPKRLPVAITQLVVWSPLPHRPPRFPSAVATAAVMQTIVVQMQYLENS